LPTIVHLLPHFRNDGNGVVNSVIDLACSQANSGFRIVCVSSENGAFTDLLRSHKVTPLAINGSSLSSYIRQLYSVLKGLGPSIVHAHTIPTAVAAKTLQPLLNYAFVTTAHNQPVLKSILLGLGDRIICVSDAVAQGMRRFGISKRRLRVVHNGPLGSPRMSSRRLAKHSGQFDSGAAAIITIAGLHHHKGVHDLIEAFWLARKTIPTLTLHILGHGPAHSELRSQAARLGCGESIHFLDFVEDPRPHLASADVFVLASHRDAFPLSVAEAREAGCAIIATRVGGIPEVLEDGRAGILVPARDPNTLARELVKLLTDKAELMEWQARARTNLEWLRVERVSRECFAVYDSITGEFRSGSSPPHRSASVR